MRSRITCATASADFDERVDVVRRRLDAHEPLEVVEHRVEVGHADTVSAGLPRARRWKATWLVRRLCGRLDGMDHRAELAEFLRARRDAVAPEQVGLPRGGGHRRTPGLRREEVAMLAGVSITWYTWLEQGRRINASPDVLSAIGRALRLDDAGIEHLRALAQPSPSPVASAARRHRARSCA